MKFSPRVQLREATQLNRGNEPHWLFIDIASTSHLFRGEEGLMRSAVSLARDLGFGVQSAVADTPAGAQAFAMTHLETICPPGEERDRLKELSLPLLLHLEGLEAWDKPSAVEGIITFFMMLGFKDVGDLSRFTSVSFQERWGETGLLLWKRINAQDKQVISPLVPTEPLEDYIYLDFPVSLVSLLLHQVQKSVDFIFARLQGRRLFARKTVLVLHCEYSKAQHKVVIEPNTPSRDRDLFMTLLENRLSELDLENPVRDFELRIEPVPEAERQLDFFEPRTTDQDRAQSLMSLLKQSSVEPGLFQIRPSVMPENTWRLVASPQETYKPEALSLESDKKRGKRRKKELETKAIEPAASWPLGMTAMQPEEDCGRALAPRPHYGESVMQAPRPTRLLRQPFPLTLQDLERIRILSTNPIERLEDAWWENEGTKRDYYFAVSSEGQCLWIFQDLKTGEYFLHGYFD